MKLSKASQKRLDARKRRAEAKKKLDFQATQTNKISSASEFQTPVDQTAQSSTQVDTAQPSQSQDVAKVELSECTKACEPAKRGRKPNPTLWKPGRSGNPHGNTIRTALELSRDIIAMMREPVKDAGHKTRLRAILERQFALAQSGNPKAVEFLFNRAFGKEVNLVAIKGDSTLPAGVGMQTILQIMRDSGDEQAIAIAAGAERLNVVDVENREIPPPIESNNAMTTTYESGENEPARHNGESCVSGCSGNEPDATQRVLCDVDQLRDNATSPSAAPHQGEGYSTDGVAPLAPSPSE